MQDFFRETNLREQLQEQCDELRQELGKIVAEKQKLVSELAVAQATISQKEALLAETQGQGPTSKREESGVDVEAEQKLASEAQMLREQKRHLEQELLVREKGGQEVSRARIWSGFC